MEHAKKKAVLTAALLAASTATHAGEWGWSASPSVFGGLSWSFGGNGGGVVGLSLKYLSTNEPGAFGFAGGATYYFDGTFGCDVSGVYNFDQPDDTKPSTGTAVTVGYDICRGVPQIGAGISQPPKWACLEGCG